MGLLEKIEKIQGICKEISSLFYQEKVTEGYEKMSLLVGELMGLMEYVGRQEEWKIKNAEWIEKLNEVLAEAVIAMEEKDAVLLADMIQYDLGDILNQIKEQGDSNGIL